MRIAYVTTYDARDVNAWSGLGYFIARTLEEAGCNVDYLGPLQTPRPSSVLARRALYRYGPRRDYLWSRAPPVARRYAEEVARLLKGRRHDVVFAPGTIPIAYLKSAAPVVTWTDATFASMIDFYPEFSSSRLATASIDDGMRLDARAIERCGASIFASQWAATSAIRDFGADQQRVKTIPFGANLATPPSADQVCGMISRRANDSCSLLFVGIEWERKGGDMALAVVEALNNAGLPARLTIVGSNPPIPEHLRRVVDVRGHLDKATGGANVMADLLAGSHFLLHPTRAECYGLVLCEANAYGVPALTTSVGGVPTIIREGVNGTMFGLDASADDYVQYVLPFFEHHHRYVRLAQGSRAEYEHRLNWNVAGAAVRTVLDEL